MEAFWSRVLYFDFIKHFRKMNDKDIVNDIRQSMDDLEDLNGEGKSFGAYMVRQTNDRIEENRKQRIEAGRKGGQARAAKFKERSDGANGNVGSELDHTGNGASLELPTSGRSNRRNKAQQLPTTEELYNFCVDNGIDEADARECYEMCAERGWKDKNGKNIVDWKKFIQGFCESRQEKRSA